MAAYTNNGTLGQMLHNQNSNQCHFNSNNNPTGSNLNAFRSKSPITHSTDEKSNDKNHCCPVCRIPKQKIEFVFSKLDIYGKPEHTGIGANLVLVLAPGYGGKGAVLPHRLLEQTNYYKIRSLLLNKFNGIQDLVSFDTEMEIRSNIMGVQVSDLPIFEVLSLVGHFDMFALVPVYRKCGGLCGLYHLSEEQFFVLLKEYLLKQCHPSIMKPFVRKMHLLDMKKYDQIQTGPSSDNNNTNNNNDSKIDLLNDPMFKQPEFTDKAPYFSTAGVISAAAELTKDNNLPIAMQIYQTGYQSGRLTKQMNTLNRLLTLAQANKQLEYIPFTNDNDASKLFFDALYANWLPLLDSNGDQAASNKDTFMSGY